MLAIGSYDQGQVSVTGIVQTDKQVTLTGVANDENAVMAYAQLLKDSNLFSRVKVQNITVKPSPTPTPSPTATLTPSPVSDNGTPKSVMPTVTPSPTPTSVYDPAVGKFTTFIIQLQPVFATAVTPQP
jgi:cell division septation protein DedD